MEPMGCCELPHTRFKTAKAIHDPVIWGRLSGQDRPMSFAPPASDLFPGYLDGQLLLAMPGMARRTVRPVGHRSLRPFGRRGDGYRADAARTRREHAGPAGAARDHS